MPGTVDRKAMRASAEYRRSIRRWLSRGESGIDPSEKRAMSELSSDGVYAAPSSWSDRVIEIMGSSEVAKRCTWAPCAQQLTAPYVSAAYSLAMTQKQGSTLSPASLSFNLPNFGTSGTPSRRAHYLRSVACLNVCTKELADDTQPGDSIEAILIRQMGESFSAWLDSMIIGGAGDTNSADEDGNQVIEPRGLVGACVAASQTVSRNTTSWTSGDFATMLSKVSPDCIGRGVWIISLLSLAKQGDATIQMFCNSIGTFLGRPVLFTPYLQNGQTVGDCVALFADLSGYVVAHDDRGLTVTTLNELYAASGKVAFLGRMRLDGNLVQPKHAVALMRS